MKALQHFASGIEERARSALFRALAAWSPRQRHVAPGELRQGPLRVLFIAEDAIGDTILSLPAIQAIHDAVPGNAVDVVTWPTAGELMQGAPYVRRTITFPRHDRRRFHAAWTIRRYGPYDAVVDAMVLRRHVRSRSFAMMLASGARYWVGEGDRGSDYLLNVAVVRPSEAVTHLERMLSLASPFTTASRVRARPLLVVSASERTTAAALWPDGGAATRVMLNISTNGTERQWGTTKFAAVLRHLAARGLASQVVVTCLDADRGKAEQAAAGLGIRVVTPSLRQLLAMVEHATLVVSPDTAVCHLASAFHRPLVSIHNAKKEQWMPFDTPGVRVVGSSEDSFNDIPADRVTEAIDACLGGPSVHANTVTQRRKSR